MRELLYERYFKDDEAQSKEEEEARKGRLMRQIELVSRPGWKEMRDRLRGVIEACEPRPGSEQDMLYAIGVRDGLRMFDRHFDAIEADVAREVKNEQA